MSGEPARPAAENALPPIDAALPGGNTPELKLPLAVGDRSGTGGGTRRRAALVLPDDDAAAAIRVADTGATEAEPADL